jgi:hypothetical protein
MFHQGQCIHQFIIRERGLQGSIGAKLQSERDGASGEQMRLPDHDQNRKPGKCFAYGQECLNAFAVRKKQLQNNHVGPFDCDVVERGVGFIESGDRTAGMSERIAKVLVQFPVVFNKANAFHITARNINGPSPGENQRSY